MKKLARRRASGLDFQRWCKTWLEEAYPGIVVHNQPMNHIPIGPGKWVCKSNDILGCIDLVAIRIGEKPLFLQVTMDTHVGRKLMDLKSVPWCVEHTTVQVWIKRAPTRVSVKQLDKSGQLADVGEIVRRKYVGL